VVSAGSPDGCRSYQELSAGGHGDGPSAIADSNRISVVAPRGRYLPKRITQDKTGRAAGMQIGDDQAVLMEMLVGAIGATRAVEIGTFTGYSC